MIYSEHMKSSLEAACEKSQMLFIKSLGTLLTAADNKCPCNELDDIIDIFNIVKSNTPEILPTNTGPYFWKYREQIKACNEEFMLTNNFDSELDNYYAETEVTEIGQSEIRSIMIKLRELWPSFSVAEKTVMWKEVNSCLRQYASILSYQRKIEAL